MTEPTPNVPARAQRSMLGMVGAMLVLLAVVGAFVAARSALRTDLEVKPTPVDYLTVVDAAQENGIRVFYPSELPEGWIATSVKMPPAQGQPWGLGMLTKEGQFVGVRQEDQSAQDLVEDRLGQGAQITSPATVDGGEVTGWRTVVGGADHEDESGLIAVIGDESVLVYGSADASSISRMAGSLTSADR